MSVNQNNTENKPAPQRRPDFTSKQPFQKKQPELIMNRISFRTVYSLNAGGRKQRTSVFVAVGTGAGKVGFGIGKSKDTSLATAKATAKATKQMTRIGMKEKRTVYHPITAKYCASQATIMPAPEGSGMKCSNTARLFFECLGIQDISAKIRGRHPINAIKAIAKALTNITSPREIAARRGVSLFRVLNIKPKNQHTGGLDG